MGRAETCDSSIDLAEAALDDRCPQAYPYAMELAMFIQQTIDDWIEAWERDHGADQDRDRAR